MTSTCANTRAGDKMLTNWFMEGILCPKKPPIKGRLIGGIRALHQTFGGACANGSEYGLYGGRLGDPVCPSIRRWQRTNRNGQFGRNMSLPLTWILHSACCRRSFSFSFSTESSTFTSTTWSAARVIRPISCDITAHGWCNFNMVTADRQVHKNLQLLGCNALQRGFTMPRIGQGVQRFRG